MQDPLIQQGVELMLFGMGTVFVFLALLVVATTAMSGVIRRFSKTAPATPATDTSPAPADADDTQLLAVIGAAVHRYRSRRR